MKNSNEQIQKAWQQYENGKSYNYKVNLYDNVNKNEAFYAGEQWKGVNANGLPTPVFNVFKRVINYFISAILSQAVKMQYEVENIPTETEDPNEQSLHETAEDISKYSEIKWEKNKMDILLRDGLLDAALTGDMVAYTYWDETVETGQTYGAEPEVDEMGNPALDEMGEPKLKQVPIMGDFFTELVDNVNLMLGNPNSPIINANGKPKQPYIIIAGRGMVEDLREEAKLNGVSDEDILKITSDVDNSNQSGDRGKIELDNQKDDGGKCTYLIKMWREKKTKTIWFSKCTKFVEIKKPVDMGIRIYPVCLMNWDKRKNSYHGQAIGTGIIPNQMIINKIHAMMTKWCMDMAYGKVIIDNTRIKEWSNAIGVAIKVQGDVTGAVQQISSGNINNIVTELFNITIQKTLEMLGANDVVLGNIKPDNAAAIVSVQQQSNIPLENVKANLYQFVEDLALIWLEFMLKKYNVPRKLPIRDKGNTLIKEFDSSRLQDVMLNAKVDVGPSTYWSEIASMQTLDNLLNGKYIDLLTYLERVPDGHINKKEELIEQLKQQQQQQAMMAEQQAQIDQQNQMAGGEMQQLQYEKMAQFMESLSPEIQDKLRAMPDDQMEQTLMQLMQEQQ